MNVFNELPTWQRAFCATGIISLLPNLILFGIPSSILTSKQRKGAINYQHIMLCFAAGGLLGDVLLHTIPHLLMPHDHHHHDEMTKKNKPVMAAHDAVETLLYGIDEHHHDHHHEHDHHHHEHEHESIANHHHVLLVGILILTGFLVFFLVEKFAAMRMAHAATGTAKKVDAVSSKNRSAAVVKVTATSETKKRTVKTRSSAAADNNDDNNDDEVEAEDDSQHHRHHHHGTVWESLTTHLSASGWLNLLADSMHNFTDGIALGASFGSTGSKGLGTAALLSVLFHEIPHELSDFTILVESGMSKWQAIQAQFLTAVAAFIGNQCAL